MKHLILFLLTISCSLSNAQRWNLSDFDLFDQGERMSLGLCGGLNAPQFYPIDINLDGINDLLVFDRDAHKVLVFEAVPNGDCVTYELNDWLASFFPYMNQFAIPKDYTGDGVPDLFTYSLEGSASMQVHKGRAESDHLEFDLVIFDHDYRNVLAVETNGNLSNLPISRIDLPGIEDLDHDGDLDVLSFPSSGGSMYFYRNLQVERSLPYDKIVFVAADNCWGGFYESDFSEEIFLGDSPDDCARPFGGGADTRHNGSSTLVFDANKDGLYDVIIGDFTSDQLVYLQNGGTSQDAWMTEQDFMFPTYDVPINMSTFLAAFQVDVNCDGKKDLLVAPNITNGSLKTNNIRYYENTGVNQDSFKFVNNKFLIEDIFDFGLKSSPAVVDLNADGWLDIVVGIGIDFSNPDREPTGLISLINNGDIDNPGFQISNRNYLGLSAYSDGSRSFAPTFADMDSDGDMDIIVGDEEGFLFYGVNVAGPGQPINIPVVTYGWMNIDAGQFVVPTVADMNSDGLLDLILGEKSRNNDIVTNRPCGNINYYQNIGTATAPNFISNSETPPNLNCLGEINTKYPNNIDGYAAPFIYNTGDSLIMVVGTNAGTIARHRVGAPGEIFPAIDTIIGLIDEGFISRPVLADLDNDDILELLVGNQRGGLAIYDTDIRTDGGLTSVLDAPLYHNDLLLFPNPLTAGQSLHIKGLNGVYHLTIYEINGKEILQKRSLENAQTIDLPNVMTGLYIVQIELKNRSITQKLIITN